MIRQVQVRGKSTGQINTQAMYVTSVANGCNPQVLWIE